MAVALVCSCDIGFSIEAPLSGGDWLAALKVHSRRKGLQSFDRIDIVKKHVKRRAGFGSVSKAFWAIPVRFSALNKGKFIENWQTGTRDSLLGAVAA
jgi:hypothetical protein